MDDFQVLVKIAGARCNLRCRYCYFLPYARVADDGLPEEILHTYIRQHIAASRDTDICFSWHGGEPTLYGLERFRQIVAWQKQYCPPGREIHNGIQTNGTLLDDDWCDFFAREGFMVGLSLDGPAALHDRYRRTGAGTGTQRQALAGLERLRRYGVAVEALCVVHARNSRQPAAVYRFFRELELPYLTFLPLVEINPDGSVGERSVTAADWGEFLCTIFDLWQERDIGRVQVQLFEESARVAFGLEHSLCTLRPACGGVPILTSDGNLYCCDHYVGPEYLLGNIATSSLREMLDSPRQQRFGAAKAATLPAVCRRCSVLPLCGGGCPKDRILTSADGEPGLNYLCTGFQRFFQHIRPFIDMLAQLNQES